MRVLCKGTSIYNPLEHATAYYVMLLPRLKVSEGWVTQALGCMVSLGVLGFGTETVARYHGSLGAFLRSATHFRIFSLSE